MNSQRPTYAEIDLSALRYNFRQCRKQAGAQREVLAVVKADAYGHGAELVARTLQDEGADQFGVATVEEGVALRQCGITRPILVFGGGFPGQEAAIAEWRLTPFLFSLDMAQRLNRRAMEKDCRCPVHLKIDTGMARVGFSPETLGAALKELRGYDRLSVEGVVSHLAVADQPEDIFTEEQVRRFQAMAAEVRHAGFSPRYLHISNSAALFSRSIPECNLVRPGIVLYGGLPSGAFAGQLDLRPVMSLKTAVAHVKTVSAGTGVSYGHHFRAKSSSVHAAIPIGYADGYARVLSNRAEVLVQGQRAPVIGTICMDWTLIDVTGIDGVTPGTEVVLMGTQGEEHISSEEWGRWADTISYEIFCRISKRVPRRYVDR